MTTTTSSERQYQGRNEETSNAPAEPPGQGVVDAREGQRASVLNNLKNIRRGRGLMKTREEVVKGVQRKEKCSGIGVEPCLAQLHQYTRAPAPQCSGQGIVEMGRTEFLTTKSTRSQTVR